MKIAIPAHEDNPQSAVAKRFSSADYLLIFDTESGDYEAFPNPAAGGQSGAGLKAILFAVSKGAEVVLTGYVSPAVANQLKANGIEVLGDFTGTAAEAVEQYKSMSEKSSRKRHVQSGNKGEWKILLIHGLKSTSKQFSNLLPMMLGVVLLTGLFNSFISREMLSSIFTGNAAADSVLGAFLGSIFAGNPVNSYVIGGELLKQGVSLFAVTAFMLSWVTVGVIQLPAEIAAFGKRFALIRNAVSFMLAILVGIFTVMILNYLTGKVL